MNVRRARPEDLPAVSNLAGELVRMHHQFDPARFMLPAGIEEGYRWFFGRELRRKKAIILVAEADEGDSSREDGSRLLGYAYGTLEERNWNDLLDEAGKINDLYVHPEARRGGIARRLLSQMMAALRELGAPRVVLLTAWQNTDAHRLFQAVGFRKTMIEMTSELEEKADP